MCSAPCVSCSSEATLAGLYSSALSARRVSGVDLSSLISATRVRTRSSEARSAVDRIVGVAALEKIDPGMFAGERAILALHRHVPDLEAVQSIRPRRVAVPALRAAHARRLQLAVDFFGARLMAAFCRRHTAM